MEINGQEVEIKQFRDDWALALMEQGVIVKLTLSRWRAISRLKYEELGIDFNNSDHKDFMLNYIDLGHEKLLPPSVLAEIASVERRARQTLTSHSFNTVWGKFVPYSAFKNWKAESDDLRDEFLDLAKSIGMRYDSIIEEVKQDYEGMAHEVWKRLYPDDDKSPPVSFTESFTSRIIDKIPDREKIVASFKYEVTFLSIPLPSFIQSDIAKAEQIARDSEQKALDHRLELEMKQVVAQEYQDKKKELVDSFLDSTVSFLRHQIAELADNTYKVLQRHDRDVNKMHVRKIKKMIKHINNLNFYNDEEIKKTLEELDNEVSKYKGERDKKVIKDSLRKLVALAEDEYMPEDYNPIVNFVDIE